VVGDHGRIVTAPGATMAVLLFAHPQKLLLNLAFDNVYPAQRRIAANGIERFLHKNLFGISIQI
jgi:hypothetical protein